MVGDSVVFEVSDAFANWGGMDTSADEAMAKLSFTQGVLRRLDVCSDVCLDVYLGMAFGHVLRYAFNDANDQGCRPCQGDRCPTSSSVSESWFFTTQSLSV